MKNKKNIEDIYPLSDNQTTFLLNHLTHADHDSGQIQVRCLFEGKLDSVIFTQAWTAVMQKHSTLRSSVHWKNLQQPLQVVHKQVNPDISFAGNNEPVDSSAFALTLDHPPNHALRLISHSDHAHTLDWFCHHIFIDGWSTALVLDDFLDLYNRLINESVPPIQGDTSLQFKDYFNWLKSCDMQQARTRWLATVNTLPEKPLPAGGLDVSDAVMNTQSMGLTGQRSDRAIDLCRQYSITISELIQTAWAVLLARLADADKVSYVLTLSGRSSPMAGIESIVGQLSTALPVQIQHNPGDRFSDVIAAIKQENKTLRGYDYLSMIQLGKWGYQQDNQPELIIDNKSYLMNSLIVVENFNTRSNSTSQDDGLTLKSYKSGIVSNYPLTLVALDEDDGLSLKLISNHPLLAPSLTQQILKAYEQVMICLIEDPDSTIMACWNQLPDQLSTDSGRHANSPPSPHSVLLYS